MLVDGYVTGAAQDVGLIPTIDVWAFKDALAEFATVLSDAAREVNADESELEFSAAVDLGTGRLIGFLADGKVQGGIKVRLTWKRST